MNEQTVVLVTGALSGIGRAAALAFARAKARVVISGRRMDEGLALADTLRALGSEAEFIPADVRIEDEVQALIERTVAHFRRLDIAVNAAGTEGESAPVVDQTAARYADVFDANVLGTLLAIKHQLRAMSAQRSGSIVNVSSTMGARGAAGAALYVASKHAVEGLTKSAALEAAAFGVRVNAVAPGPVQTPMLDRLTQTPERKAAFLDTVPLKRAGTPDEIAEAIVYVASASFMTGEVLRVNGGRTAS
ncbi:A-factor type gamma-butyrolactone 1'-reductase (1S-forming) [Paraburkholderia kirstenboschensis]|uniref:SDR family NAD(P)-dependent oxidoreductase n=1 Tax=Paraburkholderia kirstenboschensis TaxID=1245436 RepID=UPI000AB3BEE6|nr:SDR family oxidoreductase [Paraburkholderia kirstenboschensis]CAD6538872.1 A-factor type gamma-butyrolactone 1'-reductase (1S-forming) [Paraburkholderia kirstenboschensis]